MGAAVPATVDGNSWSVQSRGWGDRGAGAVTLNANAGENDIRWAAYNFNTTTSGSHQVTVTYSESGTLDVYLNDVAVDHITVSGSGTHTSSTLALEPDLHGVRLSCTSGSVSVATVRLE
jgi:hypothetical protein